MMIENGQSVVFSVDSRGVAVQMDLTASRKLVEAHQDAQSARIAADKARLASVLDAASIPDECGPDIIAAPGRGGFVLQRLVQLIPHGEDEFVAAPTGYGHRSAIRSADIFDRMQAQALRAKRPMPLTPGQVAIGRRYRDLVEILEGDGCKLSNLHSSGGSADGGNWMDRRLELAAELDRLQRRVGHGIALKIRRIRPSMRAIREAGEDPRGLFSDLDIVHRVCVEDWSATDVLRHFRWQLNSRNKKAVAEALSAALMRMIDFRTKKGP